MSQENQQLLSQDVLLRMFQYRDGALYWNHDPSKTRTWNTCRAGKKAGGISGDRLTIVFRPSKTLGLKKPTCVQIHRLVFCYHHGFYPDIIDHANGNPLDNRIDNLRQATPWQNSANAKKYSTNTTGFKGVSFRKKNGKFYATVSFNKKRHFIGEYQTLHEASVAYESAAMKIRGEWHRHA